MPTPLDPIEGYTYPIIFIPEKGSTKLKYRSAIGTMNVSYSGFIRQNLISYKWN